MLLLKDNGHGITEQSLKFWHDNKDKIGDVKTLEASFEPLALDYDDLGMLEYNVEIKGSKGSILLSGCNSGYSGEGPNGTAKILAELGVPLDIGINLVIQNTFGVGW